MKDDGYERELYVAVRAVHMACWVCQRVQDKLVSGSRDQVRSKDDDSPVIVAGAQFRCECDALVCCFAQLLLSLICFLFGVG